MSQRVCLNTEHTADLTSGKSSVLEALLELPFDRDSGLCTRFATQITMRRTNFDSITISIIPKATASAEGAAKLRGFKKGLTSLNGPEFLKIFEEACKVMNICLPRQDLEPGQMTFSNDVLKIELCGPSRENPSIIDIPGIFHTPTPESLRKPICCWLIPWSGIPFAMKEASYSQSCQHQQTLPYRAFLQWLRKQTPKD